MRSRLLLMDDFDSEKHLVGEEVDDVADAFGGELRLGRVLHGRVEEPKELPQRRLVHDVDQRHFYNQEVEDTPPGGHRPVFLPGLVDLHLRLCRNRQLLTHLDDKRRRLFCPCLVFYQTSSMKYRRQTIGVDTEGSTS